MHGRPHLRVSVSLATGAVADREHLQHLKPDGLAVGHRVEHLLDMHDFILVERFANQRFRPHRCHRLFGGSCLAAKQRRHIAGHTGLSDAILGKRRTAYDTADEKHDQGDASDEYLHVEHVFLKQVAMRRLYRPSSLPDRDDFPDNQYSVTGYLGCKISFCTRQFSSSPT